jgi:hypothetical protein
VRRPSHRARAHQPAGLALRPQREGRRRAGDVLEADEDAEKTERRDQAGHAGRGVAEPQAEINHPQRAVVAEGQGLCRMNRSVEGGVRIASCACRQIDFDKSDLMIKGPQLSLLIEVKCGALEQISRADERGLAGKMVDAVQVERSMCKGRRRVVQNVEVAADINRQTAHADQSGLNAQGSRSCDRIEFVDSVWRIVVAIRCKELTGVCSCQSSPDLLIQASGSYDDGGSGS